MNKRHIYKAHERHEYEPPPCPRCGDINPDIVYWIDISTQSSPDSWIPARSSCTNPNCPGRPQ